MTTDQIKKVIAKMRADDAAKKALLEQCLSGDRNALFAVRGLALRQARQK